MLFRSGKRSSGGRRWNGKSLRREPKVRLKVCSREHGTFQRRPERQIICGALPKQWPRKGTRILAPPALQSSRTEPSRSSFPDAANGYSLHDPCHSAAPSNLLNQNALPEQTQIRRSARVKLCGPRHTPGASAAITSFLYWMKCRAVSTQSPRWEK